MEKNGNHTKKKKFVDRNERKKVRREINGNGLGENRKRG